MGSWATEDGGNQMNPRIDAEFGWKDASSWISTLAMVSVLIARNNLCGSQGLIGALWSGEGLGEFGLEALEGFLFLSWNIWVWFFVHFVFFVATCYYSALSRCLRKLSTSL